MAFLCVAPLLNSGLKAGVTCLYTQATASGFFGMSRLNSVNKEKLNQTKTVELCSSSLGRGQRWLLDLDLGLNFCFLLAPVFIRG